MADASFDVVVIGGGHQGLIAANYMARNGMTVGLFEQRRELGGGGATESRPASGFLGNPCAHIAGLWASPLNQDFKLHEHGLNYIFPDVHGSMIFPDGYISRPHLNGRRWVSLCIVGYTNYASGRCYINFKTFIHKPLYIILAPEKAVRVPTTPYDEIQVWVHIRSEYLRSKDQPTRPNGRSMDWSSSRCHRAFRESNSEILSVPSKSPAGPCIQLSIQLLSLPGQPV